MQEYSILENQIKELDLSESFKAMSNSHHFRTLADILNWPVSVLLIHQGFTYHHYEELRNFLKKNGAFYLLKT